MKPSRPYLVRALNEWLLDCDLTPYVLVDATQDYVTVPQQFVEDGRIVLNLSPSAIRGLHIDDQGVSFNARFSGQPMDVYVPMCAVLAIYSSETGEGMAFGMEPGVDAFNQVDESEQVQQSTESDAGAAKPDPAKKRPSLTVVK